MTKAKTPATEATTEGQDTVQATTEGQDTVQATTEGQDTVQATTEGQDTVQATTEGQDTAGADAAPANDPDGNPPSTEAPGDGPQIELAPQPNLSTLQHLARQIDQLNHTGLRGELVEELRGLYGAVIVQSDKGTGVTIDLEGVVIEPADSMENALTNWANAARRLILEATA